MKLLRALALYTLSISSVLAGAPPHHQLEVQITPELGMLKARDTITLAETPAGNLLEFGLRTGLEVRSDTPNLTLKKTTKKGLTQFYSVKIPNGIKQFSLIYQGVIQQPPQQQASESRQFQTTTGTIAAEGVFLDASSQWVPWLPQQELLSFELVVKLPFGWDAVSQGQRTQHLRNAHGTQVSWQSPEPQQEVYLIAARFTEYSREGRTTVQAFLREPDEALATRYLDATQRYLAMYEKLLGPYPYKKFALVENFWETGYGMPSFTLLGSQVIRFPFILNSSYPHEILHNWWGNGVYVDYQSGNWSEGLTSYLADHLLQEQQGKGADYRRGALQKYTDFAAASRDFPLSEFRGRFSNASEAVGYGKTMLLMHMLRLQFGDKLFIESLQRFYRDNLYRSASFSDLAKAFSATTGQDVSALFTQWVERSGAPQLGLAGAKASGNQLTLTLQQRQPGSPYTLQVPVAITLEGQATAYQTQLTLTQAEQDFQFELPARPLRVDIDPEFDLFRRLDQAEIPPALSLALGAERSLIVLPAAAPAELLAAYRKAAEGLAQNPNTRAEIVLDNHIDKLPSDRAVFVLGWENTFRSQIALQLTGFNANLDEQSLRIDNNTHNRDDLAAALSVRIPANAGQATVWIATNRTEAIPGLFRKLPHYSQSSYTLFAGSEPRNIAKGMWQINSSPLSAVIKQADGLHAETARARLAIRKALVE